MAEQHANRQSRSTQWSKEHDGGLEDHNKKMVDSEEGTGNCVMQHRNCEIREENG